MSQISGWETYCSECLKFQGCWFERFGFLLVFNGKQVIPLDVLIDMIDDPSPHIWSYLNKEFCFLSVFLELSKPFFCEIPHSQHVSSNLECADRRKAYFLSFSTRVERKWRNHYIATFSLSTYSLEEFEISWLTYTPIFPMHVFIHELDCLL